MRKHILTLSLIGAAFILFFFRLGDRALWSSDEGRYAEIPREMLERGDFVSPHLNYVRYFEKPPLIYWLTAANLRVFGQTEGAARFWPAFLGALGIAGTLFFARRWFGLDAALWSGFFLLTSIGYFLVGRYLVLDMALTFFFSMSLFAFLEGFQAGKKSFLIASYILLACAVMIKGLVACAFFGAIVLIYLAWTRQMRRWRQTGILWGIPLFLVLTAPWVICISKANPSFLNFFFLQEHFQRFLSPGHGRHGPVYYFLGIGMLFFFPWSLFVPFIGKGLCSFRPPQTPENRKRLFLLIWLVFVFAFFSLSKSKLPPYILPVVPPLAILTGFWVDESSRLGKGSTQKIVKGVFGFLCLVTVLGVTALAIYLALTHRSEKELLEPYILCVAGFFLLGAAAAFGCVWQRGKWQRALCIWGVVIAASYPVVILGMEKLDPRESCRELAQAISKIVKPQETLAIYGGFEDFSDLPFYLKRRVVIAGTNIGELTYGSRIGNQKAWFLSVEEFKELLRQAREMGRKIYCIAQPNEYNELRDKGIQELRVVLRLPKAYLLVSSPL